MILRHDNKSINLDNIVEFKHMDNIIVFTDTENRLRTFEYKTVTDAYEAYKDIQVKTDSLRI